MQEPQRGERHDREPGRERQVGVRDAEHVAEEQALQPRRRVARQRQQHAEPEQAGDDDGDRRVAPDLGRARRPARRRPRRRAAPPRRPSSSGSPSSAATTRPGSRRVGQRLGAVGEVGRRRPSSRARRRSTPSSATSAKARRRIACDHGSRQGVPDRAHASWSCSWWCAGSSAVAAAARQVDDRRRRRSPRASARVSTSPGAPKATCAPVEAQHAVPRGAPGRRRAWR